MSEGQALQQTDTAIYKRWVQFGLLSSHSRLHGSKTSRTPWNVDEEACDVLKKFCELKNMLMPYLFAQAIDAKEKGLPLMRSMVVEFPDDKVCQSLDLQYMLGESLLVAPIFNDEGTCEYYLPPGSWTGLLDGKVRRGPGYHRETFDNFHLPLLVREDSALPVGRKDKPDYCWEESVEKIVLGACTGEKLVVPIPSLLRLGEIDSRLEVQMCENGFAKVSGSKCELKIVNLSKEQHL